VTKVPNKARGLRFAAAQLAALIVLTAELFGATAAASNPEASRPAEELYLQLGRVGLDPARVYQVREASLERSAIHITLEDGTIAFTQDVMGRVTGAFFEGDGEILVVPPNEVERGSMSLFTGMAILEERFVTAYFRFNDDAMSELLPDLRAPENAQAFVRQWNETAQNMAQSDAMRLLVTLSRNLPGTGATQPYPGADTGDRMLHARLQGTKLGVFDVLFDSAATEQVQLGQARSGENGETFYDVWASFTPVVAGQTPSGPVQVPGAEAKRREESIAIRRYVINAEVKPPKQIHAEARLKVEVGSRAPRALLFELSRFLQVESVEMNGQPVEFIHNPAVEGTQISRRGNDIIAVILPQPPHDGQKMALRFVYGGEVLAEAGSGLLYVGERGTWYPNRGLAMADFDLTFHYPPGWTLVATGKPTPLAAPASTTGEAQAHWVSERPIPVAGFNLGKYKMATAQAGAVTVETYATMGVERDFPSPPIQVVQPNPNDPTAFERAPHIIAPQNPSPTRTQLSLAEAAARAIQYFSERFGPYPYSRLALTQMPGRESQGWPGLVFLSSYAFLTDAEREQLHFDATRRLLQQQIPAHETAHQWWGDLISWSSYRDQWLSEGLANYCSLMMLQQKNPAGFREIMERYRLDLVRKNKDGVFPKDAGPVTLGGRLLSSHFPEGYEAISYGRGTWLFHMLRTMLQDSATPQVRRRSQGGSGVDEPFVRALRKARQRYEGKSISTRELLEVFAEELPPALRYEGKNSLDWFLAGWVNGTALPKMELKSVKFMPKAQATIVSGTILQKEAPAELVTSVPVYAVVAGKSPLFLGRVFADGEESSFRLSAPAGAHKIVLDPYETILTSPK
jgi:Peptidase family M1 domain